MNGFQASSGFQAYLETRAAVQRMKGLSGTPDLSQPSHYWAQELDVIDYMIDASPLIVAKLRSHAFHVTGTRPYDYREKGDRRRHFEGRFRALWAFGYPSLLVPESPVLGGFGFEIDGKLVNVDTLKFYEVLIGMERAGVLSALRAIDRPVVCEIGAGWGGFAYQVKTLFPGTTYVIVDLPELFLFSATYLKTTFPDATVKFVESDTADVLDGWRDADFVFVPNTLAHVVSSLALDLTVNMVSFQEMTDAQVRAYVRIVADAGCPTIYSLNRERSPYNQELVSVSDALSERYALSDVSVLESDYVTAMKKPPVHPEKGYLHRVGRLISGDVSPLNASDTAAATSSNRPRVVLGMTLYNNARHLPSALDSLLGQTYRHFTLVLLDDASSDETEAIARGYAERDSRVRYFKHATRRAMIATWREVVDLAQRECPDAEYFAWVSDHDRWRPRWLETLVEALDGDAGLVLAYPITRRLEAESGAELDKGPRVFETVQLDDLERRWAYFCRHVVGSGDMVYGLIRLAALRRAGTFRTVLRPDRLLIAELTLQGRIRQVPEVLWLRRQSTEASVSRQHHTLVLPEEAPRSLSLPPWLQHAQVLRREYVVAQPRPISLPTGRWYRMLLQYQVSYGWRHLRKSETSHAVGRSIDNVVWTKKVIRHYFHHAVYHTLVGGRAALGKLRRLFRRGLYHVLVFSHRVRGRRDTEQTPTP